MKKILSMLVAILFTAGTFVLPITVSAQGTSGEMTGEGQAQKSKTKKAKKQKKAKKPSSTKKSKKTQEQQA